MTDKPTIAPREILFANWPGRALAFHIVVEKPNGTIETLTPEAAAEYDVALEPILGEIAAQAATDLLIARGECERLQTAIEVLTGERDQIRDTAAIEVTFLRAEVDRLKAALGVTESTPA